MINTVYPIALRNQYNAKQASFSAKKYREYDDENTQPQKSYTKPILLGTLAVATGALLIAKRKNIAEFFKSLSDSTKISVDGLVVNGPTIIGSNATIEGGSLGSFKTGKDKVTIINGIAQNSKLTNSEFSQDCKVKFQNCHFHHVEASTHTGERFSIVDYKSPKDNAVNLTEISQDIIEKTGQPIK